MNLNPDDIRRLAKFTLESGPEGLTCEEWLHAVGEYVEARRAGEVDLAANERLRRVALHVEECRHCAEELEVLEGLLGEE